MGGSSLLRGEAGKKGVEMGEVEREDVCDLGVP